MRLVLISDTHGEHGQVNVPDGDVLICTGDITMRGGLKEIESFGVWMSKLPHAHKLIAYGNHELNHDRPGKLKDDGIKIIQNCGGTYLEDESVVIDEIKFWLSATSPFFCDWAFNRQRGPDIASVWAKIPDDVDVIGTHGPPFGVFDQCERGFGQCENVGCVDLMKRIGELHNLKLSVFGHIHSQYSAKPLLLGEVQYVNASVCNEKYQPVNKPVMVDL